MSSPPRRNNRHPLPELFTERQWQDLAVRLTLTNRQRQIARLICLGYGTQAMAVRLGISKETVRMHVRGLLGRLGVGDRVGVVVRIAKEAQSSP